MSGAQPTTGGNFIAGAWRPAQGTPFTSYNPATGEVLWQGRSSTGSDVDSALWAARSAAQDWGRRPFEQRLRIVEAFASVLAKHSENLAIAICREVGKPLWDARTEVRAMIDKIAVTIAACHERRSPTTMALPAARGMTRYKPHGVLAVFGPYNFPGHISNGHIVPAILCGNAVVFKPSELAPRVAERTVACWEEVGLPSGVLNLIHGDRETGALLVRHPGHDGVLFTGSRRSGLSILRTLVERPEAIVALELGGNNPLVVHAVDNVDAAVYLTLQSAFITAGQRCTCARRLIVPDGNEAFVRRLVEAIPHIRVGMPESHPEPFLGPLIHAQAVDAVLAEQSRLVASGGVTLIEARRLPLGTAFVSPGLIDATRVEDRGDEEVFGPLLQLIRVSDFESAVAEANRTRYGLVAGLLSDRPELFETFFRDVRAGLINWNAPTTGASGRLPFGGVGQSGNHRPAGYFMVDACNAPIASLERETLELPDALLPGVTLP